MLGGKRLSTYR